MSVLRSLYTALTWLGAPFIYAYVRVRARRGKEDADRLNERFGYASRPRDFERPLIWIHAVSVGEANSALSLIHRLHNTCPHVQIMLTTGTVTSARLMEERLLKGTFHQYVPVDIPQAVKRFIEHWQPDVGIWIESEIWPNLIYTAHENGVPLVILNGRISGKSFERWLKVHGFIASLLRNFSLCGVQTQQQRDFYTRLGAPNAQVLPNLKLLAEPKPVDLKLYRSLEKAIQGRPVFFGASTHGGEEEFVLDVAEGLRKSFPDLLTIIAPRHVDRVLEIKNLLKERDLSFGLLSENLPQKNQDVFLVDSMGVMETFYTLSQVVFVGATWVPKGGHNPIEPAQCDCYLIYGPHTYTNADLFDLIHGLGLGHGIQSVDEAVKIVSSHISTHDHKLHEPYRMKALRDEGMNVMMQALAPFLPPSKNVEIL